MLASLECLRVDAGNRPPSGSFNVFLEKLSSSLSENFTMKLNVVNKGDFSIVLNKMEVTR